MPRLILGRKSGESIVIGDNIRVTVHDRGLGQFRLVVDAPREIPVDREEVRIRKINRGAPNGED